MSFGLVYWRPFIYRLAMGLFYGEEYDTRYKKVSAEVGNLEVLDVCCGDARIASYLPDIRKYRGIDFNPGFVEYAKKRGLAVTYADVRSGNIPEAECVLLQGSLYHFYPLHREVLKRLFAAAKKKVILSEPVRTLSRNKIPLLRRLAQEITKTPSGVHEKRFTKEEILSLAEEFGAEKTIDAGTDIILVFNKK